MRGELGGVQRHPGAAGAGDPGQLGDRPDLAGHIGCAGDHQQGRTGRPPTQRVVDEFDGTFQRLRLEEGPHRIEIRLDGFDTLRFDVRILLDSSITLRGDLRPLP